MSNHQPTRARARAATAVAAVAMLTSGCAAEVGPAPLPERDDEVAVTIAPAELELDFDYCMALGEGAQDEPCFYGDVTLRVIACSAKLSCEAAFMHDPLTASRAPTLVTGFSCGFPDMDATQDALVAYHPEVRCYTAGDPATPATWEPPGGVPVTPLDGESLFFSHDMGDDVYTNSALLLRPLEVASRDGLGGHGFCVYEAWGAVAFDGPSGAARRPQLVQRAPAVTWRATLSWTPDGWDCHTGEPALTSVERVVLAAAAHDLPAPVERAVLPASHAVVLLREEPLTGLPGLEPTPQHGARLRFNAASWFPLEPDAPPEPMTTRQLWVERPGAPSGVPADLRVEETCADLGASGIEAIALRVSDEHHIALGAIVVRPRVGAATLWDCERTAAGACTLWSPLELGAAARCLAGDAP